MARVRHHTQYDEPQSYYSRNSPVNIMMKDQGAVIKRPNNTVVWSIKKKMCFCLINSCEMCIQLKMIHCLSEIKI